MEDWRIKGGEIVFWISWKGSSEGKGCACSVTSSCHTKSGLCSCDSNMLTVLKDEDYATSSSILPVTGI